MKPAKPHILTINGGSSSIEFDPGLRTKSFKNFAEYTQRSFCF
jgi:hypothetical protein